MRPRDQGTQGQRRQATREHGARVTEPDQRLLTSSPTRQGTREHGIRGREERRAQGSGFTLIEIMIVVAIMAMVMTMSAPMVYKLWHKAPMIKAVRDTKEVLSRARAQAILHGVPTEVVFHPAAKSMAVSGASPKPRRAENEDFGAPEASPPPPPAAGVSATLDDSITIEMLDVNLTEYKDAEVARVRFYPNGTCDELTLILRSEKSEWYKITLEITTSLATVGPVDR